MSPSHRESRVRFAAESDPAAPSPRRPASATAERRRRARHYRLRRRDLVGDLAAGLVVAILLVAVTAGLGVLALLDLALVGGLVVSGIIGRRRRRGTGGPRAGRRPVRGAGRRAEPRAGRRRVRGAGRHAEARAGGRREPRARRQAGSA
jgi:hypothetical protein